jgi:hypothetical protein
LRNKYEEMMLAEAIIDFKSGRFDIDINNVILKLESIKSKMSRQYDGQYALWNKLLKTIPKQRRKPSLPLK